MSGSSAERRAEIVGRYPFELDRFQLDALDALDAGDHVIVAAPTGSGKTVVAEYGVETMLLEGRRAFYTAPIKALSNQKYRDLVERHGADRVGLLTGDTVVNADAQVIVMTTEVLRNMIYAGRDLSDLGVVVLDEVHYLQDAYRGPVWEEVIIHLPAHVQLVCLSATVSNATDLGDWIETVRGPTRVVVETRRPVELDQHYLVADRTNHRLRFMPTLVDGQPNSDAIRLDASAVRFGGRRPHRRRAPQGSGERKLATPGREEVVAQLDDRGLLPAIYFIFSRAQCDEAARTLVDEGWSFGDPSSRQRLHQIAAERLDGLDPADLDVLEYEGFMQRLEAGVASHHAGMVPPFKEVVERAFVEGLIQVVFATETLALGVNMPARSVVIEKLTKYTGDGHEVLSPAQYTQLTGRAGRRGIDERGAAVVLWSPFVRFDQVAELAASTAFHLRSAFRPTYNMVANLVRTHSRERARQLLTLSFAQHQADRDIVRFERRIERQAAKLAELEAAAMSPFGDIEDYRHTVAGGDGHDPISQSLADLRPGAVIHVGKGKHFGPVAVVAVAHRKSGIKVTAVTPSGHSITLNATDFDGIVEPIGTVVLPGSYAPQRTEYRREVGRRIKGAKLRRPPQQHGEIVTGVHPVEADPELRQRLRAAERADRLRNELSTMRQRIELKSASLGREFDAVLDVLAARGYVDVEAWQLTARGRALADIFHECDLLVAEALADGLFDGLEAAELAGLVSCLVYEHRSPDDPPRPWFPSADLRRRWEAMETISDRLRRDERAHGLAEHRPPDPGFVAIAFAWTAGESFAELVDAEELTGGDFVRTTKQLVDLLQQLAQVAPSAHTRQVARQAVDAARRDVVADTSVVAT